MLYFSYKNNESATECLHVAKNNDNPGKQKNKNPTPIFPEQDFFIMAVRDPQNQ
jgi:hypothetical protein